MKIILENTGKRFNKEWIFRNINYDFSIDNKYAILGTNGSGKSTLLQIIAGAISQTEGEIKYVKPHGLKGGKESAALLPLGLGLAAPYLELPEEMTWKEAVTFHGKFKKFASGFSEKKIIELSELGSSEEKQIRNFSSGMKQRARLALVILSDTPLLLLDEPCANLDSHAIKWYQNLISEFTKEKLVIVCSNYNKEEYSFCNKELIMKTH